MAECVVCLGVPLYWYNTENVFWFGVVTVRWHTHLFVALFIICSTVYLKGCGMALS